MRVLDGWENFYVIAGSSAGALIGLQFVVITPSFVHRALRMMRESAMRVRLKREEALRRLFP